MGLRAQAEAYLETTLEDPNLFGQSIELIAPDGEKITVNGQVIYKTMVTNDLGLETVVNKPVVTVRASSLSRVPLPTDSPRWACRIPETPRAGADVKTFIVETPEEGGGSLGIIRLYLTLAEQS